MTLPKSRRAYISFPELTDTTYASYLIAEISYLLINRLFSIIFSKLQQRKLSQEIISSPIKANSVFFYIKGR